MSAAASIPAESTASSLLRAQSKRGRILKRVGDISFSLLVLGLGSPLLLLLALVVKLSSKGSVFYCQRRIGRGYKGFGCLKFRTMRKDADRVLAAVLASDPALREEFARDFKLKNDPRITPIGRFLRRSSLDELPQFINVLKGEMSLVGPRPHAVEHNEYYRQHVSGYMQRHAFKPGITGLAQVEGWRGETASLDSMVARIDADLRYQRSWSLKLDMKIMIKTLLQLRSPNAY